MQDNHEKVLVLDFGGQYNQLIRAASESTMSTPR